MSWGDTRSGGGGRSVKPLVAGVVAIGVVAVLGLGALGVGGPAPEGAQTPEPTPTTTAAPTAAPAPTPTAIATATATPSATPTATPVPRQRQLDRFKSAFEDSLALTYERDRFEEIPVLATAYRETDDGTLELLVVWRSCDAAPLDARQHDALMTFFAVATDEHDGAVPGRLRSYAVSDLADVPDRVTYVDRAEALAYVSEEMTGEAFAQIWAERLRAATDEEEERASQLAVNQSGEASTERAFSHHHDGVAGWCEDENQTPPLAPS